MIALHECLKGKKKARIKFSENNHHTVEFRSLESELVFITWCRTSCHVCCPPSSVMCLEEVLCNESLLDKGNSNRSRGAMVLTGMSWLDLSLHFRPFAPFGPSSLRRLLFAPGLVSSRLGGGVGGGGGRHTSIFYQMTDTMVHQSRYRCSAPSCRELLGPTNTQRCGRCSQETCLTHRFPDRCDVCFGLRLAMTLRYSPVLLLGAAGARRSS